MAANRCGSGVPLFARMAANSPARANGSEQMWFGRHETLNVSCVVEASLEIANKITLMLYLLGENLIILLQNHYLNAQRLKELNDNDMTEWSPSKGGIKG